MKVGDLVKWIGFPGATLSPELTGPKATGMIVRIDHDGFGQQERVDVAWGDGTMGNWLYPETIDAFTERRL